MRVCTSFRLPNDVHVLVFQRGHGLRDVAVDEHRVLPREGSVSVVDTTCLGSVLRG